jgi:hypothetical protein
VKVSDIRYYQSIADDMIAADSGRDKLFKGMERIFHCEWSLPSSIKEMDWVMPIISTGPRDGVKTTAKVLSALQPRIHFQPMQDNQATQAKAAEYERMIGYWWKQASKRRRGGNLAHDLVMAATLYNVIACQVIYIPYQKKLAGEIPGVAKENWTMAERYGPFAVRIRNPKDVHASYNDLGVRCVLYTQTMKVVDVIQYWGKRAKGLKAAYPELQQQIENEVTVYEYCDAVDKIIWVQETGTELMNEPHKLPFMPWVYRAGGTDLEEKSEFQYDPLLASVFYTKQWEVQNVVDSLWVSEVISRASAPRKRITGPDPEQGHKIDYGDPVAVEYVTSPNVGQDIPPATLDPGLVTISDKMDAAISRSSIPRMLQDGNVPANTQFATVNAVIQLANGAIMPYKELAQLGAADICEQMVRWVVFAGDAQMVYGTGKEDNGKTYMMIPEEVNVDHLQIEVELKADMPTDRIQKINAATMAVNQLGMSKQSGLEEIGVIDVETEERKNTWEKIKEATLAGQLALIQAESQLKIQQAQMQMQMQAQQVQQQQQQAQQQQQMQAQAQQAQQQQGQQQQQGVGGQGFNPAQGGTPPATANPQGTPYEAAMGQTRGGQQTGGGNAF